MTATGDEGGNIRGFQVSGVRCQDQITGHPNLIRLLFEKLNLSIYCKGTNHGNFQKSCQNI